MIVCIPSLSKKPTSGKAIFCERLAKTLASFEDVTVISDIHQKHDISLHIILIEESSANAKKVLRIDGVYHNIKQDFNSENREIRNHLKTADAVVYQSQFSRSVADRYLFPYNGPCEVIFNGADPDFYKLKHLINKRHKYSFIAYSRWRPHKRLLDTIESFLMAAIDSACLYVVGDLNGCGIPTHLLNRYFREPNIQYLGTLNQLQLAHLLDICDASIHLCWIDACPNSVVEAIASGLPVISNNVGGTQELVRPSGGIVCEIDDPWDLSPCDLYSPPPIDRATVAEALYACTANQLEITKSHIDIHNVALQYKLFFENVLGTPS